MTKSPQRKSESQSAKFAAAAREVGCDEREKAFDAKLRAVALAPPPKPEKKAKAKKPAK